MHIHTYTHIHERTYTYIHKCVYTYIYRVAVGRCAYCMQQGESLYSVALQWRTNWLDIWSGAYCILNKSIASTNQIRYLRLQLN